MRRLSGLKRFLPSLAWHTRMYGESELKQEWLHLDPTRSDSLKSISTPGAGRQSRAQISIARAPGLR